MRMEWDEEPQEFGHWHELPDDVTTRAAAPLVRRLDLLLPLEPTTEAVTPEATLIYLDTMLDMVSRQSQPLALLRVAPDNTALLRFLGAEGAALIGKAVCRCLRQETRAHDVVGGAETTDGPSPEFHVICPLLDEAKAFALGERLRAAMRTQTGASEQPWLTISIGIANLSLDAPDAGSLVARAAESLRRARRQGDRVWRHSDTLRAIMELGDSPFPLPDPEDGDTPAS